MSYQLTSRFHYDLSYRPQSSGICRDSVSHRETENNGYNTLTLLTKDTFSLAFIQYHLESSVCVVGADNLCSVEQELCEDVSMVNLSFSLQHNALLLYSSLALILST